MRFQNNIQSIFNRVRLLYGATPIEDIPYYNVIVRGLTEWTGSTKQTTCDQTSIAEGIGGTYMGQRPNDSGVGSQPDSIMNTRQSMIHGVSMTVSTTTIAANAFTGPTTYTGQVPNASVADRTGAAGAVLAPIAPQTNTIHLTGYTGRPVRRYQVQLALGIFNQEKLIPTKFMASQLAIEITLENAQACMYYRASTPWASQPAGAVNFVLGTPPRNPPSYTVRNVNLIPEILEFDSSYDENFLRGLQNGGVPIKFSTWNNFRYSQNGIASLNLQIQERSRSVKSIFVLQRRDPATFATDSGASFFNTALDGIADDAASTLNEFQFRIGGR